MALANPLPPVQGARLALGPDGGWQDTFIIAPGISDYVTGGYVITALACRLKNIQTAWVSGANSTAIGGWVGVPVFAFSQIGGTTSGAGFTGYSQFLFYVYIVTTGGQVANGGNLTGNIWQVTVQGY